MALREIVGSWTYTGDPAASNKDKVRSLLGDTQFCEAGEERLVSDEEIAETLSTEGSPAAAAARWAENLSAYFARKTDRVVSGPGGTTNDRMGDLTKHFADLALRLWARAAQITPSYAGGISVSDHDAAAANTDRIQGLFRIGMFDNPGTATDSPK